MFFSQNNQDLSTSISWYNTFMSSPHSILEIRTSRDAEHTPETAMQLFATLPHLHNNIFYQLLGIHEKLSFEILVQNQTIYFQCYVPLRLLEYLKGVIRASYPESIINELTADPAIGVVDTTDPNFFIRSGSLVLEKASYYPLKTYQDFSDIDPLITLISTLSKNDVEDQILIQFIVSKSWDLWKIAGYQALNPQKNKADIAIGESVTISSANPQKALIEKKLKAISLKTAIKVTVSTRDKYKSNLLLETITTALNSISQSESNSINLRKNYFFKKQFLESVVARSFKKSPKLHLTVDELATLYHLPNQKLSVLPNIAWGKNLLGEPPEDLPIITSVTPLEEKKDINVFAETNFKNQLTKYGLRTIDRRRHMYVIGKTGTGKSTLLANMAINDLKKGNGLCVIDPHGDLVDTLLDYIPSDRINDVIYFNPADVDRTVKINLFEGENVIHRELIASGIVSIFHKLYDYSWGPRLEYILRNSLLTLLKVKQSKLSDVLELLTNQDKRAKLVDNLDDPILKKFWIDEFEKMPDRQRTDSIAPILNKVGQFVSSPLVRNVVNTVKSSFSIEKVMDEGKILLANLSQGMLGEDNATLLGAMLITKIQLAAMGRVYTDEEKRRDFYLYVDEFQNFATQAFNKILSEARKYRLNLILANQYIAQIPEDVQKAIFGNCGSILSFVMGADDAAVFQKEYGEIYSQEDLVSLSRHQIINKLTINNVISRPFPAFTLALAANKNQNREKVIKVSRERYASEQLKLEVDTRRIITKKERDSYKKDDKYEKLVEKVRKKALDAGQNPDEVEARFRENRNKSEEERKPLNIRKPQ